MNAEQDDFDKRVARIGFRKAAAFFAWKIVGFLLVVAGAAVVAASPVAPLEAGIVACAGVAILAGVHP